PPSRSSRSISSDSREIASSSSGMSVSRGPRTHPTATGCSEPLLLVVLDDVGRPHLRLVRILAELAQRPPLPQQIPALIELDADRLEPRAPLIVELVLTAEGMLLVHELLDRPQNSFVGRVFVRHGFLPSGFVSR